MSPRWKLGTREKEAEEGKYLKNSTLRKNANVIVVVMPRRPRSDTPGNPQHLMIRGIDKAIQNIEGVVNEC